MLHVTITLRRTHKTVPGADVPMHYILVGKVFEGSAGLQSHIEEIMRREWALFQLVRSILHLEGAILVKLTPVQYYSIIKIFN